MKDVKRILSLVLCSAMLLSYFPAVSFAAEEDGLCEHHTTHVDCGYVAAVEAVECDHEHDEFCGYAPGEEEIPCDCSQDSHTEDCAYTPAVPEEPCTHEHGDCSYVEAVEEQPCDFECEDCADEEASAAAIAEVKALMDALPELDAVKAMTAEDQKTAYEQVQAAYEAYGKLTEEQQKGLANPVEVFEPLFEYFNTLTTALNSDGSGNITASGTCGDNLTWVLDDAGVLTISGTGYMKSYYVTSDGRSTNIPWFSARNSIKRVIVEKGVISIGAYAFYDCGSLSDVSLPEGLDGIAIYAFYRCDALESISLPDGITRIGDYAFSGNSALTELHLPSSITSIGDYAFFGCEMLASMTIPKNTSDIGYGVFGGCKSLSVITAAENPYFKVIDNVLYSSTAALFCPSNCSTTAVAIPDGIKIIGDYAFENCRNITQISMPDSISSIKYRAFSGCTNLAGFNLPSGVSKLGEYAFYECRSLSEITIPENLSSIPGWAFYGCSSLAKLSIPNSITTIGKSAFCYCTSLTSITLPESITTLETHAFGYTGITSIVIPDNITSLPYGVLANCQQLKTVTIPISITNIHETSFDNCISLTDVYYDGSLADRFAITTEWVDPWETMPLTDAEWHYTGASSVTGECGERVVWSLNGNGILTISGEGAMYNYTGSTEAPWHSYQNMIKISTISFESGVTEIGDGAFSSMQNVTSISFSDTISTIGESAFAFNVGITSITIPESVISIGSGAFICCSSLESITIPDSVTSIDGGVFYGCASLSSINIPEGVTYIGDTAFAGCQNLSEIVIPATVAIIDVEAFGECDNLKKIIFEGNAPEFPNTHEMENDAFYDVTATAYYPANNTTWTNDVMQNYGGTITWVPYSTEHVHEYNDKHVCECGAIGGTCGDNLIWVLSDGMLTISGTGSMEEYSESSTLFSEPWASYRSRIQTVFIDAGVTHVDRSLFYYNQNLTAIYADENNPNYYDDDGILFNKHKSLIWMPPMITGAYQIADGVKSIGAYAFSECDGLTSVIIPDSVTSIGTRAFAGLKNLTSVTIGNGVTEIGGSAFYLCSNLDDLTLGNSVKYILGSAFFDCGLSSLVIPDSTTYIDQFAFQGCPFTTLTLGNGVQHVGYWAFSQCPNLTSVVLPASVKSIDDGAFWRCKELSEVRFQGEVPELADGAFSGVNATAYYPADNDTWTEEMHQNYGGTITWVPYSIEYTITINKIIGNGTVTSDKTTAKEGDLITLTVTPDPHFAVDRVTYQYGDAQHYLSANDDGTYSFIMPAEDVTVSAKFRYATHVSGIPINAENAHDVLGDGTVSYDLATNTMRLDGAVIEGSDINGSTVVYGIHSMHGLNIVLGEKNSIIQNCHEGIEVFGALTISGGSLIIQNASTVGIWERRDHLTINGSTITVNMTQNGGHAICADRPGSTITINSGKLTLYGGQTSDAGRYGLAAFNLIFGNDAHIIASGGSGAVYVIPKLADGASGKSRTAENTDFVPGIVYNNEQYFEFIGDGVDSSNILGLAITQQPTNAQVKLGERYCVEVKAVGEGLQYQWYLRNAGSKSFSKSTVKDNTYDDVMTASRADREVYCVITDAHGNKVTTDTVKLICLPGEELAITSQPKNASAKLNEEFCISVEAVGDALKYQWYWRNVGSTEWRISGQKDNTYDDVMTSARHNREVYCVITDGWGKSVETETATITGIVTVPLAITRQPESQTVMMGEMFNVTFDAVGDGLKYQWYFQNEGDEKWYTSAQKDNSYDDVMTKPRHSRSLYCVVTDAWGNTVHTEPVVVITATQRDKLAIIAQPEDASAKLNENFCVTVEAQGDALKYQWYWRDMGSEYWNVSGQRDNTYDDVMTKARHNREVKCVISDMWGNTVESEIAAITAIASQELAIVTQPTDASAAMGENFCVTVEAQGDGLTYTWYFKNAGSKNWSKSGVKDNTYDDVMTKARAGRQVYCVITDVLGNQVTTDVITLNLSK